MSNRPDWNEWILKKNAEFEQEELRKSDNVSLEKAKKRRGDLPENFTIRQEKPLEPLKGLDSKGRMVGAKGVPDPDHEPSGHEEGRYEVHGKPAKTFVNKDEGGPANPHMGSSAFTMDHVREISAMKDHGAAKKRAHEIVESSTANPKNKAKIKAMINGSRNSGHLAQGMSNHILAHPSEGLKVTS